MRCRSISEISGCGAPCDQVQSRLQVRIDEDVKRKRAKRRSAREDGKCEKDHHALSFRSYLLDSSLPHRSDRDTNTASDLRIGMLLRMRERPILVLNRVDRQSAPRFRRPDNSGPQSCLLRLDVFAADRRGAGASRPAAVKDYCVVELRPAWVLQRLRSGSCTRELCSCCNCQMLTYVAD